MVMLYHIYHCVNAERSDDEIKEIITDIADRNEMDYIDHPDKILVPRQYEQLYIPVDGGLHDKIYWERYMPFIEVLISDCASDYNNVGRLPDGVSACKTVEFEFQPSQLEKIFPVDPELVSYAEFLENFNKELFVALSGIKALANHGAEYPENIFREDMIFYTYNYWGIVNTRYYGGKEAFLETLYYVYRKTTGGLISDKGLTIEELDNENLFFHTAHLPTDDMEAAKTYSESQEYHIMHAIKLTRSLKEINEIISKIAARNEIEILPVEDSSKLALEPKLYECPDDFLPIDVSAEGIKKWDWSSPIIFFGIETNGLEATGPYFGALPPGVSDFHMIKLSFLPSDLNHTRPKKDGTVNFREFLENLSKEIFLELSGIKSLAISSEAAGELPAEFNGDMIFHLGIFFGIVNTSYYGGKDAFIEKLREAFHMVPNPTRDATTLKEPEIEELDDETLFFRARYLYTFGDPLPPATAPWRTK